MSSNIYYRKKVWGLQKIIFRFSQQFPLLINIWGLLSLLWKY